MSFFNISENGQSEGSSAGSPQWQTVQSNAVATLPGHSAIMSRAALPCARQLRSLFRACCGCMSLFNISENDQSEGGSAGSPHWQTGQSNAAATLPGHSAIMSRAALPCNLGSGPAVTACLFSTFLRMVKVRLAQQAALIGKRYKAMLRQPCLGIQLSCPEQHCLAFLVRGLLWLRVSFQHF